MQNFCKIGLNPEELELSECPLVSTFKRKLLVRAFHPPLTSHVVYLEPEVESEVAPEVESEDEPEVEPKVEPEVESEVEPEVASEVEPEVKSQLEPEVEAEGIKQGALK